MSLSYANEPVCPAPCGWPPAPWGACSPRLDGDAFDAATCGYLAMLANDASPTTSSSSAWTPLTGLALGGKTLRGSRTAVHLLTATRRDTQTVVAQRQIDAKSNEIPAFTPLLSPPGPNRHGDHR
jgi:hypothetical protein